MRASEYTEPLCSSGWPTDHCAPLDGTSDGTSSAVCFTWSIYSQLKLIFGLKQSLVTSL